jgi:hypothetical protein
MIMPMTIQFIQFQQCAQLFVNGSQTLQCAAVHGWLGVR